MFHQVYSGRRVLVTGDSGFKGSWLCSWLVRLGAEVCGVSLPMTTGFVHSELLKLPCRTENCDVRDREKLIALFSDFQPEIVFHLAAQPLVRLSYAEPAETFNTNVMGTVNVLEACRAASSVRAVVAVTSDKCYENRETAAGYRETDPMGGYDPYSAGKGCAELVISCYRRSFFNPADFGKKHQLLLASARAGNVIGGGDWADDRLVPDLMRAAAAGKTAVIRSPRSVRPWQHVLEPLSGYLLLGGKLYSGDVSAADAWNFGPADDGLICVEETAAALARNWEKIRYRVEIPSDAPHEAGILHLDCTKALEKLAWRGTLTSEECFAMTAQWYRRFYEDRRLLTADQLTTYIETAERRGASWIR